MSRKINLNFSDFRRFREDDYLYVDKTRLIEHLLEDTNAIHLFCRPRRVGKTMNLSMLRYFFSMGEDASALFQGLYIEKSPFHAEMNRHPVIYLSFKDVRKENYDFAFVNMVASSLKRYLTTQQLDNAVKSALEPPYKLGQGLLRDACENIYQVHGLKTIILIDEYDKPIMDNIGEPGFGEIHSFIKAVLGSALKDNPYLERAVITGVNRIAQESMFSDLNNISIIDTFKSSPFDTDFGFTEDEVAAAWEAAVPEQGFSFSRQELRDWYNHNRVGNAVIYFSFSVMSAMQNGQLNNYWGRSGIMDVVKAHLTPGRVEQIIGLVNAYPESGRAVIIKDRLTLEDLIDYGDDDAFYSMLIQTGYLTYDVSSPAVDFFVTPQKVRLANRELWHVWKEFILRSIHSTRIQDMGMELMDFRDTDMFAYELGKNLSHRLSFFDFDAREPEKTYHVFVAGVLSAFGHKWTSNRESGRGRYDICVELPQSNLIFEFKKAATPENMEAAAKEAIQQILERDYAAELAPGKKTLLIGIGFHGKTCQALAREL